MKKIILTIAIATLILLSYCYEGLAEACFKAWLYCSLTCCCLLAVYAERKLTILRRKRKVEEAILERERIVRIRIAESAVKQYYILN